MIKDGAEIISIVGAPNSGKTVYFFNLMRQLQKKASSLGISVTVQDEGPDPTKKTSVIYKGMVKKMYEDDELPPKTPVIEGERPIPLIFKVSNEKAGKKGGKSIYIVFYDTPGEAFQDREQMDRMADHVSNSAGILLFIDPYNIKKLTGTLQSASEEQIVTGSELENENVLNSLLQKVKRKESEDKPFAIVFSKIDAVLDGLSAERAGGLATILDLDRNSSFLKTKKFNLSEIDQISNALEEMSEEWDVEYIKSQVNEKYKEENIRMFAVSSLGSQPKDSRITDLRPYRVMDPLIWILYKIGFDIPIA
jgi:GTPase Era involved in 16S rRNA processing